MLIIKLLLLTLLPLFLFAHEETNNKTAGMIHTKTEQRYKIVPILPEKSDTLD